MHDVPISGFLWFAVFAFGLFLLALWDGYWRAKRLREQLYQEVTKRFRVEDDYQELMLHVLTCRMLMWKEGVEMPDLPPHLSHLSKDKPVPRGPAN